MAAPPPPPPHPAGAPPADERALKHHYFFQKLYAPIPSEGEDDICFGTGYRTPKVPIVLQTIPEGKDAYSWFYTLGFKENGDEDECRRKAMLSLVDAFITENLEQYTCRIDGAVFTSQATAVSHMHDAHKNRVELLLFDLLQDMEQNHMGCFFTKLLYSDFIFPSPIFNSKELSSEFPSVLAPDLERPEKGKTPNGKPASEKKKPKTNGAQMAAAALGFTEEEMQQMERRLFSGRFLVDASTEAKLSAKVPTDKKPKVESTNGATVPTTTPVPNPTAVPPPAAAAASVVATPEKAADKATKKKEAKEAAAREAAAKEIKEQAAREALKEKQAAAAEKLAKEKADKEKAEKEKERQRREAERKAAEKERQDKEKAAKAAAEAAERERVRLESTAEFKKVKKQMEDELMTDLFEEVIFDFMNKLAARTLQEQRREDEKAKQEAADKAAAEADAQQEPDVTQKEKRNAEKKILRDLKKLEGDRVIDDIIDEVVLEENLTLAPEMLQEMRREAQAAALAAAMTSAGGAASRRPGAAPVATGTAPALWNAQPATPNRVTPAAARGTPVSAASTRPSAALPAVLRTGGKGAAKAPALAVPAYQPFPMSAPSSGHTTPLGTSTGTEGEGADEFDEYLSHERLKLNMETDEPLDIDDESMVAPAAAGTNIFGLFSSKLTEPVAGTAAPAVPSSPVFAPSPRRNKPAAEVAPPPAPEPVPRQAGMSPPPPPLRSVPEDFGFDPILSVTCYNLPSMVPVTRADILTFFRDHPIATSPPDFSSKIQFLRGAESGACYVQFENLGVAQKALARDRHLLRDRSIRVVPAQGLRTSNSGQRFALNVQTRNAQGQQPLPTDAVAVAIPPQRPASTVKTEAAERSAVAAPIEVKPPVAVVAAAPSALPPEPVKGVEEPAQSFPGFGLSLISDFRSTAAAAAAAAASQHSLSSLLNTEQDSIVTPFDRKAKTGTAIGSAVGAPGKAPGPPGKSPATLSTTGGHAQTQIMSQVVTGLDEDDALDDETFASSFDGEGGFDASGQFVLGSGGGSGGGALMFSTQSSLQMPLAPTASTSYMRASSPPAPYRGTVAPPAINPRVVTPPPPGFHAGLPPMSKPAPYAMPPLAQHQDMRQPTVAPASSAEAAFMDRFL